MANVGPAGSADIVEGSARGVHPGGRVLGGNGGAGEPAPWVRADPRRVRSVVGAVEMRDTSPGPAQTQGPYPPPQGRETSPSWGEGPRPSHHPPGPIPVRPSLPPRVPSLHPHRLRLYTGGRICGWRTLPPHCGYWGGQNIRPGGRPRRTAPSPRHPKDVWCDGALSTTPRPGRCFNRGGEGGAAPACVRG